MNRNSLGTLGVLCWVALGVAPVCAQQSESTQAGSLEEVIVTAQKYSQDVQKAAATVTVIQADTLTKQGTTDLRGLSAFAPMAEFGKEGPNTQIFIRGIGQETDDDANDPAAAVYIDQVYMPRDALASSLFDIERVEIVSGPQGTLYGRDAVGGAVNIYTRKPTKDFSIESMVEGGNYSLVHAFGALNAPVTDSVDVRVAVNYQRHDGYLSYGGDDEDSISGRIGLLYAPTPAFSNLVRFEYDHMGGVGDAGVVRPECASVLVSDCHMPSDPWYDPAAGHYDSRRVINKVADEANFTFGNGFSLTSITGYVDMNLRFGVPVGNPGTLINWSNLFTDFSPVPLPPNPFYGSAYGTLTSKKQWSEELRLAQGTTRYHWVTGLYWLRFDTNNNSPPFVFPQIPANIEIVPGIGCGPGETSGLSDPAVPNPGPCYALASYGSDVVRNSSYAAFADGTYSVLDWLRLNAGLRFSIDKKSTEGSTKTVILGDFADAFPTLFAADKTWRSANWKVGIEGDIPRLPTSHFYAKAETSYVEGGVNDAPGTANSVGVTGSSYGPEKVLAYTVGLKNRFADNRLQINGELFYYDYKDLQLAAFNATGGGTVFFNAPKSVSYGTQLDVEWRVAAATQLGLNLGLLRSYIREAVLPPPTTYESDGVLSNLTLPPALVNNTSVGGPNGLPVDYSGYDLPNAPKVSLSAHLGQTFALPNGAALEAYVSTHYSSKYWVSYTHQPGAELPSFTKTDATLTYASRDGKWYVSIWGKNLENTARLVAYASTSVYGIPAYYIDPPRTFGGRIGVKF